MNDEIKEMTKVLKSLGNKQASELYYYITNLQQKEELFEKIVYKYDELKQENEKLNKENERLKKQLEYLRTDEYLNQVKWERNFNETMNKELNLRIEKAVEYVKEMDTQLEVYGDYDILSDNKNELLNILNGNGEDNER